ncbi:putative serine esterase Mb1866c isoform X1 [Acropora millepora]|nr:putative serine esterase Mb1866c isoform X1 [Acropora millepora]
MSFSVNKEPLVWITVRDGIKLAAKLWLPDADKSEKFPAILEFLPYRRVDCTAQRDEKSHSYFCCYGYVCVRVDMRGSGDSEGYYYDEYEGQEQEDCCDVINWISRQEWCNGNVGMYGKSWGGFNGLQVAALQPSALKTVISTYSTDDRYSDDIHYRGGCVLAREMLSWAHIMFLWNARPPHPDSLGSRWKEVWLDRLNKSSEPWVHKWLSHQTRDRYWQHGSVAEDYSSISCPVFLIGGFSDLYTDAVFRMIQHLKCPVRAVIGPWSHEWPLGASPGPQIDHLKECLRWWDFHLKGLSTGVMDEPRLKIFLRDGISNACKQDIWPGKWIAEDLWPSSNVQNQEFELHGDRSLRLAPEKDDEKSSVNEAVSVKSSFLSGAWGGLPFAFSLDELPMDQRLEDPLSECWETATLPEPIVILGFPEVRLQLSSDSPCALVAVRLCDVFPNGESSLISRGVFNLTHRNGHSEGVIQPLTPHESFQVQFKLDSTAYKVSAGHKIRLALSSVHWPLVWPSPLVTSLSVQTGSPSMLLLPARIGQGRDAQLRAFETPAFYNHAVLPVEWRRNPRKARNLEISQLNNEYKLTVFLDEGCVVLKDTNTIYDETNTETFTIKDGEPKTAKVSIRGHVTMKKDSEADGQEDCELNPLWDTRVEAISEMWSDEQFFYLKSQLTAWHGSEECFDKTWTKKIERFCL